MYPSPFYFKDLFKKKKRSLQPEYGVSALEGTEHILTEEIF